MKEGDFRGGSVNDLEKNRKGEEVLKPMGKLYETHGITLLVYESGPPYKLINPPRPLLTLN
jgi:hypothetical protein